jgi:thiamine biosynthesis lipoprotein
MKFFLKSTNWGIRGLALAGVLSILTACQQATDPILEISGPTMGTRYTVKLVPENNKADPQQLETEINTRLAELNQVFSTYIPDSELSLLNSNPEFSAITVSDELMQVLQLSRSVYEISAGAFDVTVGPLVNLWGFGPAGPRNGIPPDNVIRKVMSIVGLEKMRFANNEISRPAGLYIDLSAIAKGYAVDEISKLLESHGFERYMVEIGGEVRTRGKNARRTNWVIGVEAPDREVRRLQRALPVNNLALATSGDYRNYFEHEGKRYSHTIDPDTGWPVSHNLASVTVLHESAAWADGLATAFTVLGLEATMEIAEARNLRVLVIIRVAGSFEEVLSSEMQRYLETTQ